MEFNREKPIYLQIADWMGEKIIRQEWLKNERIPSVREIAALLQVNPNTAMRAYDSLQSDGIIYNKRGVGYYVCEDADIKIIEKERTVFLSEILPGVFTRMNLIGLTIEQLNQEYENFKKDENENKH